jgi:metal-dependent amidase/aminoacylase/carboxypeptidase family protein
VPTAPTLGAQLPEFTSWQRDLRAHPERGFEPQRSAALAAEKRASLRIAVHRRVAGAAVVGTGQGRVSGNRSIGPRSEMQALRAQLKKFEHASKHPGRMHAHGRDGHTTLPLAAARSYRLSRVAQELPLE